jgi:hypothetical protein
MVLIFKADRLWMKEQVIYRNALINRRTGMISAAQR